MPSLPHNANGLTPKMEMFCQLLARGQNLSDSYREAYASNGSPKTVNEAASRLWSQTKIRARVEELCQRQSSLMMRDAVAIRRHVFSRLVAESQNQENKGSERIAALALLGRVDIVGMFREIHSVERLADRPPEEIEQELNQRLNQFLIEARGTKRNGATSQGDGVSTEIDPAIITDDPPSGTLQ